VDCTDEPPETTTRRVIEALAPYRAPARLPVRLAERSYDILVGRGCWPARGADGAGAAGAARGGGHRRSVAPLHLPLLRAGLEAAGVEVLAVVECRRARPANPSPSSSGWLEAALAAGADRRTAIWRWAAAWSATSPACRGGGVARPAFHPIADDAAGAGGFLRGRQDRVNLALGKNLVGAFHQPLLVLADTGVLATLPARELRAAMPRCQARVLQGALWDWCEARRAGGGRRPGGAGPCGAGILPPEGRRGGGG
jgi:shikimate kinase/3-dehydroquinate synthase